MSKNAPTRSGCADPMYGDDYYRRQLHREHWFRNNCRKHEMRWRAILRMVDPQADDVVLDLGCAAGEHTARIAPLVGSVTGIDSSPAAIRIAREHARTLENVAFIEADATRLEEVPEATVDKIMAVDFIEHIDDRDLDQMLQSAWRVLRPLGRLAIYTPCGTHYVEWLKEHHLLLAQIPGHIAVRTPRHCERLFARLPWRTANRFFLASTYPLFGWLDRLFAGLPVIGACFRFRYCIVLEKPALP